MKFDHSVFMFILNIKIKVLKQKKLTAVISLLSFLSTYEIITTIKFKLFIKLI